MSLGYRGEGIKLKISLIRKDRIFVQLLPDKVKGRYWLKDTYNHKERKLMSIDAIDGVWYLNSNKTSKIIVENNLIKRVPLEAQMMYKIISGDEESFVLIEELNRENLYFQKIMFKSDIVINIGRDMSNEFIYKNSAVSSRHAILSCINGQWSIKDNDSTNGTYVNDKRIQSCQLQLGDCIYILGLKIIIGTYFIAVNNPKKLLKINSNNMYKFVFPDMEKSDDYESIEEVNYFYRSPRFMREINTKEIVVDSPPNNYIGEEMPAILVIGPAVTMGMASLTMGIFSIYNGMSSGNFASAIPSLMMSLSMLLGTLLWPLLSKRYDKKRREAKEEKRQEKYKKYLKDIEKQINEECYIQKQIINENFIGVDECIKRILQISKDLWNKSKGQSDFLEIRVGTGNKPASVKLNYSPRKFTIEEDNLRDSLYELCESEKIIYDVPITLSLFKNWNSGIIGEYDKISKFIKGIIVQLVTYYSYIDLKMVFIYDEKSQPEFSFLKWLPHVFDKTKNIRFIANNINDIKEISSYLDYEIEKRINLGEEEIEELKEYYVIFSLNRELGLRCDSLKKLYNCKNNLNISVVHMYGELKDIPNECSSVIELSKSGATIYNKEDVAGNKTDFVSDIDINEDLNDMSVQLSNILLDEEIGEFNLPEVLSFLEMFDVGKVEHLNSQERWKTNNPVISLQTPIGINTLGDTFVLDLHEKYHGPHGLIAGMTGSGKSEFIISFILSLAVNFHPNEVGFVLIDYKGGGMAKAFKDLPHTQGIITNLDGKSVSRSLISIDSELKRRQKLFGEVEASLSISNMNIYKYQNLYREHKVQNPLTHLFIVADEFAELKQQEPEFMEQLISTARIGRSLGVHLILATQRPTGVVDDQIASNAKFRICLKVQDKQDSMEMLNKAEAAHISETGRFYLMVGYNEIFELGQSAWTGAPYFPSNQTVINKDNDVEFISNTGNIIKKVSLDKINTNPIKQLDSINQYLIKVANEEHIQRHELWLPELEEYISIESVYKNYLVISEDYYINPVIGLVDDPVNQNRFPLTVPITKFGNVVIFGITGSGKEMFLTSLVCSLVTAYSQDEVSLYLLDCGAETMRKFVDNPFVKDVMFGFDSDKIKILIKKLNNLILERRKLFSRYGGNILSFQKITGKKYPSIVVMINNFDTFNEMYDYTDELSSLTREGSQYGIYFVITATNIRAIPTKINQNLSQTFVMQLNDSTDYSLYINRCKLVPKNYKGRGVFMKDDMIYEFQVADFNYQFAPIDDKKINMNLLEKMPEKVTLSLLETNIYSDNLSQVPIGIEVNSLIIKDYYFDKQLFHYFTGYNNDYLNVLNSFADMLEKYYQFRIINLQTHVMDISDIKRNIDILDRIALERYQIYKDEPNQKFEKIIVVVDDYNNLVDILDKNTLYEIIIPMFNTINYSSNIWFLIGNPLETTYKLRNEDWYVKYIEKKQMVFVKCNPLDFIGLSIENKEEIEESNNVENRGYVVLNNVITSVQFIERGEMSEGKDNS